MSGRTLIIALASASLGIDGVRVQRQRRGKFIAGVPVLNYELLQKGNADFSSREEDWVVVVDGGASDDEISAMCARSRRGCKMAGRPSQGGVPFLALSGTQGDLEAVIQGSKTARSIELDPPINMIPDDTEDEPLTIQDMSMQSAPWGLERVGVPSRPSQGKGVHVYVADTGIRFTHRDFDDRAIAEVDMTSGSAKACQGDTTCALDARGHGTHCAGTAAGRTYGIASEASVHAVKALGDDGSAPWSHIIGAFDYLARNALKPAVVSASLGAAGDEVGLNVAVEHLVSAGVTVVVASGNVGVDACTWSPASVSSAITVGAVGFTWTWAYFSNYGSCVDMWAPGVDILSASVKGDSESTEKSGTSQACPHIAGGAALLLEAAPALKPAEVLKTLQDRAQTNFIDKLPDDGANDVNKFLWVGAGSPPSTRPTPGCRRRSFCWFS